ncbi:hypothetical protein EJB05_23979 [Eragrostis curvula]|uniref:Uncharacterized protein n=1 Tax=Eragrostis curvula TaxID=38414 RepID=A0A5J9V8F7_9POAL|nr:hypothetical protein EJB05_23979 [Eragrostis curvula]
MRCCSVQAPTATAPTSPCRSARCPYSEGAVIDSFPHQSSFHSPTCDLWSFWSYRCDTGCKKNSDRSTVHADAERKGWWR